MLIPFRRPRVDIGWVFPVVVLVVALLLTPVAVWLKGRAKDREWRAAIAASSASVRATLAREAEGIAVTDTEIINALGDSDARLTNAESRLAAAARSPVTANGCPVVPARCLALGVREPQRFD